MTIAGLALYKRDPMLSSDSFRVLGATVSLFFKAEGIKAYRNGNPTRAQSFTSYRRDRMSAAGRQRAKLKRVSELQGFSRVTRDVAPAP